MENTNNMSDFEYYFMERKEDQAYPFVAILEHNNDLVEAQLDDPLPRHPVLANYLKGSKDFVTKNIAEVMMSMNMEGVRIVPVELSDRKGGYIEDYYCIYVDDNTYEALDKTKSDYEYDEECKFYFIDKVVLDTEALKKIPLSKRLGWRLFEEPGTYLYHKTVVDEIKKLEPTGIVFINVEDYEF
ncbi:MULTISPECIES: DUF1629 domain-containing protein [unclassified Gilliamella]|uniref:imm11 family protein n=1 Tax=unclassified Gilliamella TaxID=2685620 RepID=UPI00130ADA35|nr:MULTISPECIES: DUF1629 domain-containing protein [unclassified Gilliamella]MWP49539.1 hypothetical protein [Gilliamella sp. Lep-s35]MWP69181.1 hypothetical protein [Gilliamella sp. Lep-s5]MWP77530.1 hypothetical protein [Gilliamella sp. Lep-s21]